MPSHRILSFRRRRLVITTCIDDHDIFTLNQLEILEERRHLGLIGLRVADDHRDRGRGLIGLLVDRDLVLQVPPQVAVAGKLELDQGLVCRTDADLVIDRPTAVVRLPVDVEGTSEPYQSEEKLDFLLLGERLASAADQLPAILVLYVLLEALNAGQCLLVA